MKRKIKDMLTLSLVAIGIVTFISLGMWYEYSIWNECRQTNSFWYCMRVLGK